MQNGAAQRTPLHAHADEFTDLRSEFWSCIFACIHIGSPPSNAIQKSHVLKGEFSLVRGVHRSRGRGHRDPQPWKLTKL